MMEDENTDPEEKGVDEEGTDADPSIAEEVPSTTGEEIESLKDQLLRAVAESENIRRRASREVENAHKYASEKLLEDLLPVLDSLEKALELPNQCKSSLRRNRNLVENISRDTGERWRCDSGPTW